MMTMMCPECVEAQKRDDPDAMCDDCYHEAYGILGHGAG